MLRQLRHASDRLAAWCRAAGHTAGGQDEALTLTITIAVSEAGGLGSMPRALLDEARLLTALRRFALRERPINLNFFCHEMTEPEPVEEARWRQALAPTTASSASSRSSPVRRAPAGRSTLPQSICWCRSDRVSSASISGSPHRPCWTHQGLGRDGAGLRNDSRRGPLARTPWRGHRIAQGIEAGGHRGHDQTCQTTTADLVARLSRALTVPIVAAGGIGSRADVEALLAAGAVAAQAGTMHCKAMQQIGRPAAITNLFSGRSARGLVNRVIRDLGALSTLPPAFPWASQALAPLRMEVEARGLRQQRGQDRGY